MKRIALCIGNDAYSILPALNCAIADAKQGTEIQSRL